MASWAALVALLLLAGCAPEPQVRDGAPDRPVDVSRIPDAVPRPEPPSRYGNAASYRVGGHTYHTRSSSLGYRERGVASWYGSKFHGRLTSNREPYDMFAMTAAHRSLPLPTYVRVTNLANGRSVVVRVNDRGPFHADRLIDLSYTAAAKLDILRAGTGLVEVVALDPRQSPPPPQPTPVVVSEQATEKTPKPVPAQPGGAAPEAAPRLFVQVGAFASRDNAERLHRRLGGELDEAVRIQQAHAPRSVYRVQVGPVASVERADRLALRLRALGMDETRLVVE